MFKIFSASIFLTIIALFIVFPQKDITPADRCRSELPQSALTIAETLNHRLVFQLPNEDLGDMDVKDFAPMTLALLKTAVGQLISGEVTCLSTKGSDPEKLKSELQHDLLAIIGRDKPKENERTYGLEDIHVWFYPKQKLLIVRSAFGIPCTDDTELFGFQVFRGQWQKVLDVRADILAKPWGEFDTLSLREPIFIDDPATRRTNILLISNPDQCNSMWYGFGSILVNPADEKDMQKIIFSDAAVYYNGDLNSQDPIVTVKGNKFRLSYRGEADLVNGGALDKPKIDIFELKNGVVRSVPKF